MSTRYTLPRDNNGSAIQGPRLFSTSSVALSGASDYDVLTPPDGAIFVNLSSGDDQFFVSTIGSGGYLAVNQEVRGVPVLPGVAIYVGTTASASGTVTVTAMWEII